MGIYRKDWEASYVLSPFIGWSQAGSASGITTWRSSYGQGGKLYTIEGLAETIPQGAQINQVKIYMNTAAQRQLQVDGVYYAMASDEQLMKALNEGKRNISIYCSWKASGETVTQPYEPPARPPKTTSVGASYVEITYEGGDGSVTVIRYGIGNEWVDCDAYVGRDGKYVPFEMHYPDNGGWQKIEQRTIEE